mmetsp:Transcript_107803/g.230160  ORF Transcript_107803/g.230160 Transcript_107803/m.230160 type:complete len:231 (+) Transcript_107803:539-1231(+)
MRRLGPQRQRWRLRGTQCRGGDSLRRWLRRTPVALPVQIPGQADRRGASRALPEGRGAPRGLGPWTWFQCGRSGYSPGDGCGHELAHLLFGSLVEVQLHGGNRWRHRSRFRALVRRNCRLLLFGTRPLRCYFLDISPSVPLPVQASRDRDRRELCPRREILPSPYQHRRRGCPLLAVARELEDSEASRCPRSALLVLLVLDPVGQRSAMPPDLMRHGTHPLSHLPPPSSP